MVVGDIIELNSGEIVPADCRLIHLPYGTFRVEESHLTGESGDIEKNIKECPEKTDLARRKCMLFSGSSVL